MATPYVGEIRMFGGNFAPAGWAMCNGQLLSISQNETLFNLIGTTYGGDGLSTYGLPNLQSRVPVHMGTSTTGSTYVIGQVGGVENVTLTLGQFPQHTHTVVGNSGTATSAIPANAFFANASPALVYTVPNSANNPDPPLLRSMNALMLQSQGGNQPHSNLQPYLTVTFIISMFGIFPSRN